MIDVKSTNNGPQEIHGDKLFTPIEEIMRHFPVYIFGLIASSKLI